MIQTQAFRDLILEYLHQEEEYIKEDIRNNEKLPENQKIDQGLLIKGCTIIEQCGNDYLLSVTENNSKLRPGDFVLLLSDDEKLRYRASIIENGFYRISLQCENKLEIGASFNIKVVEIVMLKSLISLLERIDEGLPGAHFLKILEGTEKPSSSGLGQLRKCIVPKTMNEAQHFACMACFKRPDIYCIQGPPGTGKTEVLSTIASAFSREGKDVLVLSNTHQAVNNALNKVVNPNLLATIVKIGAEIKAEGLLEEIVVKETFNAYLSERNSRKKKKSDPGDIVGMTLQASIVNLGLRQTGFQPSIILVDEAGQIPLSHAAAIGTYGSGSIIFIGDDRQMPPIYHEKLQANSLSKSIFEHLSSLYPSHKTVLNITYRMNDEITNLVSKNFYEPYGIELTASDFSKDRILRLPSKCEDLRITKILNSSASVHILNVTTDDYCEDYNIEEAMFAASLIEESINMGIEPKNLAVITPFRRQVKAIRECCLQRMGELPLIDTVERLQGQDVDMIILSFAVSDLSYYNQCSSFLLNKNRLNVMISRAKKKVVILAPICPSGL